MEVGAAKQATKTIPIVFASHADPISGAVRVAGCGSARALLINGSTPMSKLPLRPTTWPSATCHRTHRRSTPMLLPTFVRFHGAAGPNTCCCLITDVRPHYLLDKAR